MTSMFNLARTPDDPDKSQAMFAKDLHRLRDRLRINGKEISPEDFDEACEAVKDKIKEKYIYNPNSTFEKEKEFPTAKEIFKELLTKRGVDVNKLEGTLDLFIQGFHQDGYLSATQNALTAESAKEESFVWTDRAYDVDQGTDGIIHVTENLKVKAFAKKDNEDEMRIYNGISDASQTLATISTTYSFSPKGMETQTPLIQRHEPQDPDKQIKQRMLDRIPDDRSLLEKIKELLIRLEVALGLAKPLEPRGEESRRTHSGPK